MFVQSFHPLGTLLRNALPGSGDDVAAVVVQDRAEVEPAPTQNLQVREVSLPKLVDAGRLVLELIGRLDDDACRPTACAARSKRAVCR